MTEFTGPSFNDYMIVMGFLMAICVALYFIKKNKHLISNKLQNQKRMKVSDITLLGQGDRALILNIDNKDYLFISGKNSGAILTEIKKEKNAIETPQFKNTAKQNENAFEIKNLIERRIKNDKKI